MSTAEFQRAGLDKLSAEELAALNDWLQRNPPQSMPPAAPASAAGDRRGFREPPSGAGREPVRSRLLGESTGWSYGTLFRLENGQTWRAVERGSRLSGVRIESPAVEIRQGIMGDWRLRIEGYNSSTRVERVE